jgi:sigma-E factor negative regulatory protein RseA
MTEQTRENISALMDGELDCGSYSKLIVDDKFNARWHQFHLISDIMHQRFPVNAQTLLSNRISKSIKQEPAILAPTNKSKPVYLRPIAGMALAASVAAMAILGIQRYGYNGLQPQISTAQVQQTQGDPVGLEFGVPVSLPDPQTVQPVQLNIQPDSRINRYILSHNEYQSRVGEQGVTPVSIFIEKLDNGEPIRSGSMTMDGVNVYSRISNGFQVTAIGEVPDPTVRQIVNSVISTR